MSGCAAVSILVLLTLANTNVHCSSLDRGIRTAEGQEGNETDDVFVLGLQRRLEEKTKERRQIVEEDGGREERGSSTNTVLLWPGGEVPYAYASDSVFTVQDKQMIEHAMMVWSHFTCITFREAKHSDNHRILFENRGSECHAKMGASGDQPVILPPNCRNEGEVLRLLGYSLGLWPEQTRNDRIFWVDILDENVKKSGKKYFEIHTNDYPLIPYDYSSIMHFSDTDFSANGLLTIKTKDPRYRFTIGQKHGLSFYDIKRINLMYQCDADCGNRDEECPGESFRRSDCECFEKDDESRCEDSKSDCGHRLEECATSEEMFSSCRKTCNYCQVFTVPVD